VEESLGESVVPDSLSIEFHLSVRLYEGELHPSFGQVYLVIEGQ
jgi:hypothetical protein